MNKVGLFFVVGRWAKGLVMLPLTGDATLYERTVIPKRHGSPCLVTCVHGHRPSPQSRKISRKFREWNGSWDTENITNLLYPAAKYQPNICLIFGQWLVGYPHFVVEANYFFPSPKSPISNLGFSLMQLSDLPPQRRKVERIKLLRKLGTELMMYHDGISSHVRWISSQAKSVLNHNHLPWCRRP